MSNQEEDARLIAEMERLFELGLETEWHERAYTSQAVNEIVARLQFAAGNDPATKMRISGFTPIPYLCGEGDDAMVQACDTCMYYVVHRRFCELPELMLPVKPQWSCRLWRI